MTSKSLLGLDLFDTTIDIESCEVDVLHSRNEQGRVGEEVVHFFEGAFLGLGEHSPEEDGVGEVADLCYVSDLFRLLR
jgi:hypothetical protein